MHLFGSSGVSSLQHVRFVYKQKHVASSFPFPVVMQSQQFQLSYPVGRKKWAFYDNLCSNGTGELQFLTLTTCKEDEFTCSDGSCQPLDNRCDLKPDCPDSSDEEHCKRVFIPEDYQPDLPPKQGVKGSKLTEPLELTLTLEIFSFDKIQTIDMMFSTILRLNISWLDRRLDFLNLRWHLLPFKHAAFKT